MRLLKDVRKWARLVFCVAFYMVSIGLAGAVLTYAFGFARPGKALFIPALAVAGVSGWFYIHDRPGNRLAESGNLAGALTAVRLWADLVFFQPGSGIAAGEFFLAWYVWGSYLANILLILAAGYLAERRK